MEDLFRAYWWLIFPMSWFVFDAYQRWLSYRANKDTLDLIKTYAQAGREPPPELLARLNKRWNEEEEADEERPRYRHRRRRERSWYQVVLFACLGMGFAYASITDLYEAGPAFLIVTFVMAALSLATLVSILVARGPRS
jgi:amino acid permease